jgi:hypothetical protein
MNKRPKNYFVSMTACNPLSVKDVLEFVIVLKVAPVQFLFTSGNSFKNPNQYLQLFLQHFKIG